MTGRPQYVTLTLKNAVVEERSEGLFSSKSQIDLLRLLTVIGAATRSPRVQLLILVIREVNIGWAQIEEIHAELDKFHRAGKKSISFLQQADNRLYYLGCGTQEIYLAPSGGIDLIGLRAEIFFFKNALDYLGVEPEIFSLGQYKSAAEIFNRERMSEASRAMSLSILSDIQERVTHKVAEARKVAPEQVREWIDSGPYTARKARERGLVDGLLYEDQMEEVVTRKLPGANELPARKLAPEEGRFKRAITFRRPRIAYIVAEGMIMAGESRRARGHRPVLGADSLIEALNAARKNERIKAVVLRLNSPGGSAVASDLIWRAVKLTGEKKPVIISLGNVAASGGYYIAVAGQRIVAMPATLTGSIGVIAGKFNVQRLFGRLGITVDSVQTGARSGYQSITRPFTESEQEVVREQMREFYEELFLKKVAEGRERSIEQIREVAEGRVWTGHQALQNGLIDEWGGLRRAFELARQLAGLEDRKIRVVPLVRKRRWLDLLPFPLFETPPLEPSQGPLFLMAEDWQIW
ncbi:MAG TPA: signal peptide peptidase SppA [Acidobacteriota bacterium]|nr:signal peptide peptidase SppA [Acidobacteriota bacterium]